MVSFFILFVCVAYLFSQGVELHVSTDNEQFSARLSIGDDFREDTPQA